MVFSNAFSGVSSQEEKRTALMRQKLIITQDLDNLKKYEKKTASITKYFDNQ